MGDDNDYRYRNNEYDGFHDRYYDDSDELDEIEENIEAFKAVLLLDKDKFNTLSREIIFLIIEFIISD